jgi:ribonucleoside-diphosphate reductase alpha chain
MAWYQNYEKEETKHARFSNVEKTDFDKDGYTPLNTFTQKDKDKLKSNEEKYYEFVSWARWYPDLFLDMLRPRMDDGNLGGIDLHFDQRVFLRATLRFYSMYGVFPRGWGKTFCEVAGCFVACMLYPGLDVSITAQSKDASSKLLKDKYNDLMEKYPLLKSELLNISQAKDEVEYKFLNGSRITNLANAQMSKGQRRHRLMIEESALLDSKLFEDVLQPIVDTGRMTKGKSGITDPLEPNHQIHFFTTAGWRNSTEWKRNITFYKGMINCDGSFIIGSDWKLACWFGRGQPKEKILKDKNDSNDALAFAKNYESKWVGATENQLIDINKLMNIRVLTTPVLENKARKKRNVL